MRTSSPTSPIKRRRGGGGEEGEEADHWLFPLLFALSLFDLSTLLAKPTISKDHQHM
jgi:hypothetical protein